jgi:hypothetical protein
VAVYLIQGKSSVRSIISGTVCVCPAVQIVPVKRIVVLRDVKVKKAVLENSSWRKIGKPKAVRVMSRQRPARGQQPQEATPGPRAIRVTEPQQGVGAGPGPVRRITEPQKPVAGASTVESRPADLRETERIDKMDEMQADTVVETQTTDGHYLNKAATATEEVAVEAKAGRAKRSRRTEKLRSESSRRRGKDLQSGMELLGLDFLLSVVEKTDSNEELDVTMRKLNFNELIRTEQLHAVDSNALKVYAMNEGGLYSRDAQCEAMKELAARTPQSE